MALRKMIGEIMRDLGILDQEKLDKALSRQKQISEGTILPEKLKRTSILAEARVSGQVDSIPLLGEVLLQMKLVTRDQLKQALKRQDDLVQKFCTLESNSLCSVMDMGALVNSSLNLVEVLSLIMKSANKVTNSTASTLMLREERTGELIFSVPTGPQADKLVDIRIDPGQGIAGWVAEKELPVLVPDVTKDKRFYEGIDRQTGFKTESLIAVPLKAKTKLIGVLEVINKADGSQFTDEDVLLLTIFASQAAMAIENARLYGELRESLEEEKQLQNRLIEFNKFLALGQMASGNAHDFNNVLGAIMGYSEMAAMDLSEDHPASQNIAQVLRASHRAKEVVNQILAFARKHELESKPVDLKKIVEEAIQFLRVSLPSTIEINQHFTLEPCTVMGDATKIHQIILNLCTNAHHAMAESGGSLDLALGAYEIEEGSSALGDELKPGPYLRFSVSDTGQGMNEEIMERIFEPYFSTKGKGVGTGLGLSVVLGIVRSHEGMIQVNSEPGKGATFDIFLPRVNDEQALETDQFDDLPRGNERILLVDDEESLSALGEQMLGRLGYRVEARTDPNEALKLFEAHRNAFDLVITDMTMPSMTGADLAKEILKLRPDIPIVLCTGFSDQINAEKAKGGFALLS